MLCGVTFQAAAQNIPRTFQGEWLYWQWEKGREQAITSALIRQYCQSGFVVFADDEIYLTVEKQSVHQQYIEGASEHSRPKFTLRTPLKIAGTMVVGNYQLREPFEFILKDRNTLIVKKLDSSPQAKTFYRCK